MPERLGRAGPGRIFETLLGIIGAVVLFAMMMLTFTDVLLRYVFNAPLRGAFEVTELMLVVLIFSGLPLVSRNDKHVTTDLIDKFVPTRMRKALAAAIHLIVSAVMLGVGWLIWQKGGKMSETGDTTAGLHIPIFPFVYLMSLLILITAVIHVLKAFRGDLGLGGGSNV